MKPASEKKKTAMEFAPTDLVDIIMKRYSKHPKSLYSIMTEKTSAISSKRWKWLHINLEDEDESLFTQVQLNTK